DTPQIVGPGILMRVELNEGKRPVFGGMSAQDRPGDEMVSAKRKQESAGPQDLCRLAFDDGGRPVMPAVIQQAIAVIHHCKRLEQVEMKRILRIIVENDGGAAYSLRPKASAGPIGDSSVEGNAPNHSVRALDVLGELAAHEGKRPRIGRVAGRAEEL